MWIESQRTAGVRDVAGLSAEGVSTNDLVKELLDKTPTLTEAAV